MNMTNLAASLRDDMTTITVRFVTNMTSGPYTYKCPKALAFNLAAGDLLAVDANNDMNYNCVGLAVVEEVHDEPQLDLEWKRPYKWVICKVDYEAASARQKKDEEVGKKLSDKKMRNCRDQALAALGLTSEEAQKLLA